MSISQALITDHDLEVENTRKLLAAVPGDKLEWRPHDKSMTLGQLAGHIAEMPTWLGSMVEDRMDFESMMGDYTPFVPTTSSELMEAFETNQGSFAAMLAGKDDAFMQAEWTMCKGDAVLMQSPRNEVIRSTLLHHLAHHRGQLTVYLRLLEVPVPATYGGTADFPMF